MNFLPTSTLAEFDSCPARIEPRVGSIFDSKILDIIATIESMPFLKKLRRTYRPQY